MLGKPRILSLFPTRLINSKNMSTHVISSMYATLFCVAKHIAAVKLIQTCGQEICTPPAHIRSTKLATLLAKNQFEFSSLLSQQ